MNRERLLKLAHSMLCNRCPFFADCQKLNAKNYMFISYGECADTLEKLLKN